MRQDGEQLLVSTGFPKLSQCRKMLDFQPAQGGNSINTLGVSWDTRKTKSFQSGTSRLKSLSPCCSQGKELKFSYWPPACLGPVITPATSSPCCVAFSTPSTSLSFASDFRVGQPCCSPDPRYLFCFIYSDWLKKQSPGYLRQ